MQLCDCNLCAGRHSWICRHFAHLVSPSTIHTCPNQQKGWAQAPAGGKSFEAPPDAIMTSTLILHSYYR